MTKLEQIMSKAATATTKKDKDNDYRIVQVPELLSHRIAEWGVEGGYINRSE